MAFEIKQIKFFNEFRDEYVDWLLSNVGDKIRIEIDLESSTYAISDVNNNMIMNYTPSMIGSYWLYDPRGQFKDFEIGDELQVKAYATNITLTASVNVVDKIDDFTIQLDADITGGAGDDQNTSGRIFNVKTPITALKYKWNFIENNEQINFISKVDGTEQLAIAKVIDATDNQTSGLLVIGQKYLITEYIAGDDFTNVGGLNVTGNVFIATGTTPTTYTNASLLSVAVDLEFLGVKPYQIGNVIVCGTGIDDISVYGFKFKLIHYTYITPFILTQQWADILNNIAPDYFLNTNCFRYVSNFQALYDYNDPNRTIDLTLDGVDGNSGWFNENFNSALTNYSVDSIVYKDNLTVVIPSIELTTDETSIEITIKNTIDSPFSNNNTKFTLNFVKAPQDEEEYQGNLLTQAENFLFDRALQIVGSAPVNGDNFGGSYQVLKDVEAVFVSSSEILVKAKIAMDSSIVSDLNDLDSKAYLLFIAIQNHTIVTSLADKVSLLADAAFFYEDATDPGMIVISNSYLRHFEVDPVTDGVLALQCFKEDEVVAYSQFYVDKTGRYIDAFGDPITIQLVSAEAKIKAKNSVTLDEFSLDGYKQDLTNLPVINDNQYISNSFNRQFHIPSAEIRNKIFINRRSDLDGSDTFYYEFWFPFLIRWEYFIAILTANGDFFDVSEPNNGWNQDWFRYSTFADWSIYYEVIIKAKKNGETLTYRYEDALSINDYEVSGDYTCETIKAYDNITNTLLYDPINLKDFILGYSPTRIEAKFSNVSGAPIDPDTVELVLGIEVYEEGGVDGRRRFSSIWQTSSDTWFKSTDTSNKVIKTVSGGSSEFITGTCLIDFTQIPLNKQVFKITARCYDKLSFAGLAKITEDSVIKITEDSVIKVVDA